MNVTAISSVTKQSEPVYSTGQALNVNLAGQAAAAGAPAPVPLQTTNGSVSPKGYQQIAAATLAASTALTVPGGSRTALIQAEAQNIRWRDDGVAPTATTGMILPVGSALEYDGSLSAIRFIAATAGAILNVSYYA